MGGRGAGRSGRGASRELGGWAARAPILGFTLVVIALAAVGWPGFVAWDARAELVDLTIAGPIGLLVILSGVAQLAIYGKLLFVGLSRPSEAVLGGAGRRPVWPEAVARRDVLGQSPAERAFERGGHAVNGVLDVLWSIPAAARANRALLAGVLALAVAGLAFTVPSGGLGVVEAARAVPGQTGTGSVEGEGEGKEPGPGPQVSRANRRSRKSRRRSSHRRRNRRRLR